MDQNRHVDESADSWLSAELEAAVAVEPSSSLLPRVRQRIANETVSRRWEVPRTAFVASGVALTLLLTLSWVAWELQYDAIPMPPTPTFAVARSQPLVISTPIEPWEPDLQPQVPSAAPFVLVPRTELAALRRWIMMAQAGDFVFEVAEDAVPVSQELSIPESISVPAITMMPIGPQDSLE
jgi:hypothetical protein